MPAQDSGLSLGNYCVTGNVLTLGKLDWDKSPIATAITVRLLNLMILRIRSTSVSLTAGKMLALHRSLNLG